MTALRTVKRIIVGLMGGTVLLVGVALIVLPGPAFIVIPAGLAILAIEFAWARRWLRNARDYLQKHGLAGGANRTARPPVFASMKQRLTQLVTGTALVAGFALVVLAGLAVAAIPIGLALLFLAFAAARWGLGNAWSRLFGRNALPSEEVA
jgi:hypothetical protein